MNIGQNIQRILKKQKRTQKDLAEYLNLSTSTLSNWLRMEERSVPAEHIISICEFLDVTPYYLLKGEDVKLASVSDQLSDGEQEILEYFNDLPPNEQQQLIGMAKLLNIQVQGRKDNDEQETVLKPIPRKAHTAQMTFIRMYNYPVGAGINTPPDMDDDYSNIKIPDEYVPYNANSLVRVSGDSMQPDYPDGCWVWVNMKYPCDHNEYMGKTVIANNHGELLLKIAEKDGLHSINESYSIITDVEDCCIIGIVIDVAGEDVVEMVEKYNK